MVIMQLDKEHRKDFYILAKEYLPDCDYTKVEEREKAFKMLIYFVKRIRNYLEVYLGGSEV